MSRSPIESDRAPDRVALLVDAVLYVGCVAAMSVETSVIDEPVTTPVAYAAIALASAPVLFRRARPVPAAIATMVLMFGVLETTHLYQTIAFPAVLCGYTMASRSRRVVTVVGGLLTLTVVLVILAVYDDHPTLSWETAKNLALVALPLTLGAAAHDRRAYTAALVARAESAERGREEEALRRVGEERLRIARDVHDVVAHAMVAINVQAGVGAHLLDRDPDQARATLRDIKRVSGEALTDLRSMLGVLRAGDTDDADDAAPVAPTQDLTGIDGLRESLASAGVDLDLDVDAGAGPLPAAVGATGYRIVQEALTNVMRHAGPTSARVRVSRDDDGIREVLRIEVEDDGGPDPVPGPLTDPRDDRRPGAGSGNGLRGMRERAVAVGGTLDAGPRPGGGWRVSAVLPVGAP